MPYILLKNKSTLNYSKIIGFFILILGCFSGQNQDLAKKTDPLLDDGKLYTGAEITSAYVDLLRGKTIGMVVNQTSVIKDSHIVDSLLTLGLDVKTIFAPEHGFRGNADAGEKVLDGIDVNTGLPLVSLYGKNKKPTPEQLRGIDVLLFDIQDVGVRFYTYISTLHYIMEAGAENNIPVVVLDRPNPNIHYVDGPILKPEFKSFVGMHPVPVVYGMTIGEYAQMINGEGWLTDGAKCTLTIVPCGNYERNLNYILPIKPSPNLPNTLSILHYPSLCFFEGTTLSVGRGTDHPFQSIGHPNLSGEFEFTPIPTSGAKYPKHENKLCKGSDLRKVRPLENQLDLTYLIQFYKEANAKEVQFFNDNNFFEKLAGTDQLRQMIIQGKNANEIRDSWQDDINAFKQTRIKYLIYN